LPLLIVFSRHDCVARRLAHYTKKQSMNPLYYSSSPTPADAPCSIHKLSLVESVPSRDDRPSPSNYFELIWITQGAGHQWVDLQKTEIINNQIICLRPGQVHRFESDHEIEGYAIKLDTAFIASVERQVNSLPLVALLQSFSCTKGIVLAPQVKSVFQGLINHMELVLVSTQLLKTELLNCYIEILITHLSHQWDDSAETCVRTRNTELVESFLSLLEKNFKTERRVAEYASCLSVTPNYLNEVIKKMTGYSAGYVIRRRVGLEAKRKALHTRMCMKEVAYSLGFSDPAHFSKFFKNTTGHNFSDFRKEKVTFSLAPMKYITE
jgi:AraC family transcriptional regulator, transcriptional activator of pobA